MKKIVAMIMVVGCASVTFGTVFQSIASGDFNTASTWNQSPAVPGALDEAIVRNHDVVLTNSTAISVLKTWGGGGDIGSLTINNATLTTGTAADYFAMTANYNSSVILNGGGYNPGGILQIQSGAAINHNSTLTLNSGSSLTTGGAGYLSMNAGSGSTNNITVHSNSTLNVQFVWFKDLGNALTHQQIFIDGGDLVLRAANEFGSLQFNDVDAKVMFEGGSITFEGVDSLEDFSMMQDQLDIWVNAGNIDSVTFIDWQLKNSLSFDGTNAVLNTPDPIPPLESTATLWLDINAAGTTGVISVVDLHPVATNTLQSTEDLLSGSWSNLAVWVGSTSNSYEFSPIVEPQSFYRIESEPLEF